MASGKILLVVLVSNAYMLFGVSVESCEQHETKPHEHDPTMFYICDYLKEFRPFSCRDGLEFNPLKRVCDHPFKGKEENDTNTPVYEAGEDHVIGHPKEEMSDEASNSGHLKENHGESLHLENQEESEVEENPFHPVDEMTREASNSGSFMEEHHGESLHSETPDDSEVEETPDTEDDEHFMKKRETYDPKTHEDKEFHDSYPMYELHSSHPIGTEEHNSTQSDMTMLMQSLYYLLSTMSESSYNNPASHGENKTDDEDDHIWHQIGANVNPSDEPSFHDLHKETGSTALEDGDDKVQNDEKKEPSTDKDFSHIYK